MKQTTVSLPHSERTEKVVLSAMLTYPEDLLTGRDLLSPSDFYLDANRRLHSAIVRHTLTRQSKDKIDLLSLVQFLQDEGTLSAVGGAEYICDLDKDVLPVRGSVAEWAGNLRELAKRRAVIIAAHTAIEAASTGGDSEQAMFAMDTAIAAIRADDADDLISSSQAVDIVNASLEPEHYRPAFPTGIYGLDSKTQGGIRPGELWVCGALPSRGKSSVARQIAASITAANVPSLIFTLEMTVQEWQAVDQANAAGVEAWRLREPQYMDLALRQSVRQGGERLRTRPIWFDESSDLHVDKIVSKARLAVLQKGIKLVVVDYAQRVRGDGREMRDQVGDVAKKLAVFAKANQVAVLLLSQLKRPNDINSRPSFEDLKESGYLGAHAHTVLLNYRPVDRETEDFVGLDEIIVAKQRHGPIGTVPVKFNGNTLQFDSRVQVIPQEVERPAGFKAIQGGRTGSGRGR